MRHPSFVTTLRATRWLDLAGWAFAASCCAGIATVLAPAVYKPFLRGLGLALPLVLVAAKDLAHAPDAWRRLRAARSWSARAISLLPPELPGMLRVDRQLWLGCLRRLRRQPAPAPAIAAQGVKLTYLERGAYGTAGAIAVVAMVVGLPMDTLFISLFVEDPQAQAVLHALRAAAAAWTLAWLLGDRWHLGAGAHVLAEDALHLALGARSQCLLPLAAIAHCERVDLPVRDWCRRRGVARSDTLAVTPFDKPNCVLVLDGSAQVEVRHYGVLRRLPRYVLLYLDRPELLAAQLHGRKGA